jgi:hypothetical protein
MSDAAILLLSVSAIGLGGAWIGSKWIERDARKARDERHVHFLMVDVAALARQRRIEALQEKHKHRKMYARVVGPN